VCSGGGDVDDGGCLPWAAVRRGNVDSITVRVKREAGPRALAGSKRVPAWLSGGRHCAKCAVSWASCLGLSCAHMRMHGHHSCYIHVRIHAD